MNSTETRWTVQERAWKQDVPGLPDDVIALLAPPVVVSASRFTGHTAGHTAGRAAGHSAGRSGGRFSGRAVPSAVATAG